MAGARTVVYIPTELKRKLRQRAWDTDETMSEVVTRALEAELGEVELREKSLPTNSSRFRLERAIREADEADE